MKHPLATATIVALLISIGITTTSLVVVESTTTNPIQVQTSLPVQTSVPVPSPTTLPLPVATNAPKQPQPQTTTTQPLPCAKWHDALRKHNLPVKVFAPIMARESACEPKAVGWNYHKGKSHRDCKLSHARTYRNCKAVKSYDVGLLQINSTHKTLTARICNYEYGKMLILQKPHCNLKVAAYLYHKGGGVSNWRATAGAIISSNR
jgi:hypothetical protein